MSAKASSERQILWTLSRTIVHEGKHYHPVPPSVNGGCVGCAFDSHGCAEFKQSLRDTIGDGYCFADLVWKSNEEGKPVA